MACGKSGKVVTAMTTDSENFTDFDNYLMSDIGIKSVPAHLFLINGKVVNKVDYTINPKEFNDNLKKVTLTEDPWTKPITATDGSSIYLKDFDVIYVTRSDCEACETQNNDYEPQILNEHKNLNILIYYMLSDECELGCG